MPYTPTGWTAFTRRDHDREQRTRRFAEGVGSKTRLRTLSWDFIGGAIRSFAASEHVQVVEQPRERAELDSLPHFRTLSRSNIELRGLSWSYAA